MALRDRILTRSVHRENSQDEEVAAYFIVMTKMNYITYSEYLHIAHEVKEINGSKDRVKEMGINLVDFLLDQDHYLMSKNLLMKSSLQN